MIGSLPTTLDINGKQFKIRTDYRSCLLIMQAFNDPQLTEFEQAIILLKGLYIDFDMLDRSDLVEARDKAIWFLDCGKELDNKHSSKPLYDWEQDEQMIFSAVNKVAGREIRADEYMHWWTFIGLFNEIGEGPFSNIVSIRHKKNTGKKLEKYEQEFYNHNREIVNLKKRRTAQDLKDLEALNELLGV